jgi:hypothetical protein
LHQHFPAVHRRDPKTLRCRHKWGRTGTVHQVHYGAGSRQAREIERELIINGEPQAGRVHDEVKVPPVDIGGALRYANSVPSHSLCHGSGPFYGAIEDEYIVRAIVDQAGQYGAGRASRPEEQNSIPGRGTPEEAP